MIVLWLALTFPETPFDPSCSRTVHDCYFIRVVGLPIHSSITQRNKTLHSYQREFTSVAESHTAHTIYHCYHSSILQSELWSPVIQFSLVQFNSTCLYCHLSTGDFLKMLFHAQTTDKVTYRGQINIIRSQTESDSQFVSYVIYVRRGWREMNSNESGNYVISGSRWSMQSYVLTSTALLKGEPFRALGSQQI